VRPAVPVSAPALTARGGRYRMRLINAGSFAAISFAVDGHNLTLVEVDGTAVTPLPVAVVSLQVAQRASVLLTTNQTAGAYWIRTTVDGSMFTAPKCVAGPRRAPRHADARAAPR
jgi:FtsP/CotA-like multicopper oxidase with cupredoxin domain